ncbi:MAG: hypothetical protein QNJ97_18570 [Myxococcota bacterium]|nr:hypothetical protein [Myxococcota bacterium]
MSADSTFLVARVSVKALSERLEWVTSTESPYEAVDPLDLDDVLLDSVFDMYTATYGAIDERFNIPDKYALFEYNRWLLIENDGGVLVGFVLLKTTAFGLKIGLTASDRSTEGKKVVRSFHERVFFVNSVYAEVSDAMEWVVSKKNVPKVTANDAQKILVDKKLDAHKDGFHYTRSITDIGKRVKIMVGKPEL